jgi:preprotein translocase subunit SecE
VNRETKRLMQRQGAAGPDGSPAPRREAAQQVAQRRQRDRASVRQFFREVRDEMRQVAWPSRSELINYTSVVLTTLIIMISLIFVLNLAFGKLITLLFTK